MRKGYNSRIIKELLMVALFLVIIGETMAVIPTKNRVVDPLLEEKKKQGEYYQQGCFHLPQNNCSYTFWNVNASFYPDAELLFNITLDSNATTRVQVSLESPGWNNSLDLFLSPGESYQGGFQTTFTLQCSATNFLVEIQMELLDRKASGTCWLEALDLGTVRTPVESWPWFFYLAIGAGVILVAGSVTTILIVIRKRKGKKIEAELDQEKTP
ncbi:MAG: hypothetical protein GF308_20495 [Candidatus Heimdallarchaeota archaeon]|nr:hypothetical protein [Candidatus Heimdallarchaeota archaeon]